jgi:hypothetical protein
VAMYEARSRNHCCRVKAESIIYSESVCVRACLVIPNAKRMRRIILCGLFGSRIFFDIIS